MELETFLSGIITAQQKSFLTQAEAKDFVKRYIEANIRSVEGSTEGEE